MQGEGVTGFYCSLTVDQRKFHRIVPNWCLQRGCWIDKMGHQTKVEVTNSGKVVVGGITEMGKR